MESNTRWIISGFFLLGLLSLSFLVLQQFLIPVTWAVILAYVTWPLYIRIEAATGKPTVAALAMTIGLGSFLILPFVGLSLMLQRELGEFMREAQNWLDRKPELPSLVRSIPYLGDELLRRLDGFEDLRALLRERLQPALKGFSGSLLSMLGEVGINVIRLGFTLLTIFFLYRDGNDLGLQVRQVALNLLGPRAGGYFKTAKVTVKAVIYGMVLTALAQGLLAGLGYWVVGMQAPILLSLLTVFFSLIPFGTPLVWGSAGIGLLLNGHTIAGVALLLWGSLVVSWIDNIIRPLVISNSTQVPFILVMFGVLGGLANFGLVGLFIGPVILAIALGIWRETLAAKLPAADA